MSRWNTLDTSTSEAVASGYLSSRWVSENSTISADTGVSSVDTGIRYFPGPPLQECIICGEPGELLCDLDRQVILEMRRRYLSEIKDALLDIMEE